MTLLLRWILALTGAWTMLGTALAAPPAPTVLIFSHSTGYRHASIQPGVAALKAAGEKAGLTMIASEDPAIFDGERLKEVDAIIFLSTTTKKDDPASEWFTGARRTALQAFVHRGGGIVGIHAASDSHYFWPWYGKLIGARFTHHPSGTPAGAVHVTDPDHPATRGLDPDVKRADEWYYFRDYNPEAHLLVTLDPASIGEEDVNPNPVSWGHEFEGARVFYTAMGHTAESYSEPWFLRHVMQGLDWVLKR